MLGAPALDVVFVHPGKQPAHLTQRFIDHRAHDPQWMIRWHAVVELLECEQAFGECVSAAHGWIRSEFNAMPVLCHDTLDRTSAL